VYTSSTYCDTKYSKIITRITKLPVSKLKAKYFDLNREKTATKLYVELPRNLKKQSN